MQINNLINLIQFNIINNLINYIIETNINKVHNQYNNKTFKDKKRKAKLIKLAHSYKKL